MKRNFRFKRLLTLVLAVMMLVTAMPVGLLAETEPKNYDKTPIGTDQINHDKPPVKVAKPETGQTAEELIKNPDQPAIYTLRTDYKVQRGEKYEVDYQPYIASVGEAATEEEQKKVNKKIFLPDLAGYDKSQLDESYTIDYDTVKNNQYQDFRYKAKSNTITIKHIFQTMEDFTKYTNPNGTITHFDGVDPNTNKKTGTIIDENGVESKNQSEDEIYKNEKITTQNGNTGSTMEVSPLNENDRKGYIPEAPAITMQVPEDANDFVLEYRYNRAHYDVVFDTKGGTPLATRTYYYDQVIPKIEKENIPTKIGCIFKGWKPSVDLKTKDGKTYKANEIIKDSKDNAIVDLNNLIFEKDENGNLVYEDLRDPATGKIKKSTKPKTKKSDDTIELKMPALLLGIDEKSREKLTFTAEWEEKEKADYAIQFWVEKADHGDDASTLEKYEYMGTRVYKDADTGSTPDLDKESPGPVKVKENGVEKTLPGLKFPDLDQARLNKIWANARFNRGHDLYLNKFFVYNKKLTDEKNKDSKNPSIVKKVEATGKTVYNIYYDRQVYDLYFTESNHYKKVSPKKTFYPEIWGYDEAKGEAVMKGGPGNLYHYKARFNEMMYKWPNDAKQTKGFTPGYQSFGWGPNYGDPNWPIHLDTPPYRLNADEFLDMANYTNWKGYTKKIDKGDGQTMDLDRFDFTTLSFGIKQDKPSIPHHMDFWMDGFKDGETIIRYDLVRTKADTANLDYGHRYPRVQGFTPHGYDPTDPQSGWPVIEEGSEKNGRVNEDDIDDLNDERDEITPNNCGTYYNNNGIKLPIGQLDFISVFFSDSDDFGEPITDEDGVAIVPEFKENGYLRYKYKRNKYPLRFNYDPSIIRDDSYFNSNNQLDTFYEFPLKVLSPDLVDSNLDREDREYFKEDPKNLLDNPENLQKLGLSDLVFTDTDGKLKVKRPDNLSDQMVFKGWALDPAGTKLIWENPKETMPTHPLNFYAKWGEPDYKWKVTFDPDGGSLKTIKEEKLTRERKTIQEGDIGQEEINTYAKKEDNDGNKQIFTVIQRQKLVEPKFVPEKKGYDFMGWEVIRYKKDPTTGDYTDKIDDSYRKTYKVPELYTFGNDVVSPLYLKAIWVPNNRVDVKVEHYILDDNFKLDTSVKHNPQEITLENKRSGYLVATTGDKQDDKYILATHEELEAHKDTSDTYNIYKEYNDRVKLNNTFFQTFRVEPAEIPDPNDPDKMIDNPNLKNNVFKFFYRPYRQRKYKVNYIDERFKGKETEEGAAIIDQELVTNGNRHYDARNYRVIPGWVLTSAPQQQLFFDINEDTNEFLGINGTGKDEITFYYKDVRVIEVPKDDPVPDGYVRVTFKADKGGSFGKDAEGKDITELHYDVIKGLKSDLLPEPKLLEEDETKEDGKYYITPDTGKKFTKWDNSSLLNDNTIINENHSFTAYFEWSGLSAKGLVRTEAFKDDKADGTKDWTNDFAPTIDQLKAQLVWREKGDVKPLPKGTVIKLYDENDNELTKDEDVFNLVKELNKADKDQLVRTVKVKAKVTFKDGKEPQELDIPITVYKNVYEALNKDGDKPLFLKEAEGKKAEKGGLSDVTGDYVMVTVQPTEKNTNKDAKVYYVNPKAWVNIPEVEWSEADKDKYDFLKWTADKKDQNENKEENGIFDFSKRHKFTDEETLIKPLFTDDVVEQKQGEDKPKVPDNFVKVIVKTTDKATDETKFEKTFWVNPTKEVAIDVTNPTGKENQKFTFDGLGEKDVNYIFKEWQKVQTGETDDSLTEVNPAVKIDLAKNQYTDKVTVIEAAYKKAIQAEPIVKPLKTTKLDTPQGKEITNDDLIKQITPQAGKEIESIEVISKPDGNTVGNEPAKVIVKYKDGTTQGTNDNPVVIPVEVHKNIIPEAPGGQRPKDALDNYVKVIFKAGTGGSLSGDLVYYVSPEVEVDMTESAGKITKTPDIGYISGDWDTSETKKLKATFTADETEFTFNFTKTKDIVEKTDDPNQVIPKGYVKVTFKTEAEAKGKLEGDKAIKIYYVNPKAEIKLVELADGKTATDKQLAVPKTAPAANYEFETWYEEIDQTTAITSERIHVAKFRLAKVTLTYDAGGADGTVPEKLEVDHGTKVRLANADNLSKENAKFAGWKIGEKTYQAGDEITLNENTTATAQWTATKHTVTFNSKGGSDVASQTVEHGNTATEPKAPRLDGKVFMGWKEKESDTNYFDFANTAITEDKTLIAIWEKPVQKIKENDPVEEQFIKVTFKEGDHGKLTLEGTEQTNPVAYKVDKNYTMAQAMKNGLVVPKAIANTYYKLAENFSGWDKALDLTLAAGETEKVFTAQYAPIADVIPIDPAKTDEEIQKERPDDMVVVKFVVDETKAFMEATSKFYVAKNKEVTITPPAVYNRIDLDNFAGWEGITLNSERLLVDTFDKDTEIRAKDERLVEMKIFEPVAGDDFIFAKKDSLEAGAIGHLELIRGSETYSVLSGEEVQEKKIGRRTIKQVRFGFKVPIEIGGKLQSGDRIRYWAQKGSMKSVATEIIIK